MDARFLVDYHRRQINDNVILSMQLPPIPNRSAILASDLFNRDELFMSWKQKLLGPVISFLSGLGHAFSIAIGIYVIGVCVYNIFKTMQAATVLYAIYGCSRQILQMFCLRSTLLMEMKKNKRGTYSQAATVDAADIELRTMDGSVKTQPTRRSTRESLPDQGRPLWGGPEIPNAPPS